MKSTGKHKRINTASLLLLASLPGYSNAEIVSIDITAVVEYVDDYKNYLGGKVKAGDQINGTYVYDTSTVDDNTAATVADYWHKQPGFGICLDVAGLKFGSSATSPNFLVELVNNHYTNRDNYLLRSYINDFAVSAKPDPNYPSPTLENHISWQLDDNTMQALSSIQLTDQPPALSAWQSQFGLSIDSRAGSNRFMIRAHVTSAVRSSSTSIGICVSPSEPIPVSQPKYIDSTLLHRSTNIVDKTEAVLYNDNGVYTIATRNLGNGLQGRSIRLPDVAGAKPIGLAGIKDTNANTYPDIALLYTNPVGGAAQVHIIDSQTDAKLKVISLDPQLIYVDIEPVPDVNRNGFEELNLLGQTPAVTGVLDMIDSKTGAPITRRSY